MLPVISIGPFSISSFGIFLAAGFLFGIFLVWRLSRAWDLPEEKVLDLTLLTFLGGLLGARVYFILENFSSFGMDLFKWLLFYKYQGFSFWGAMLGGFLTLRFFSKKFKINFWQALDFAAVGLLGGLIFLDLGCFFAGCNIGVSSKLIFAVPMVGKVGTRIPIQIFEAALIYFVLWRVWRFAMHFHIQGTVAAFSLIYLGLVKLITEPLREIHNISVFLNAILILFGINLFYNVSYTNKVTKRKILSDIKSFGIFLISIISDAHARKEVVVGMKKSWYNYKVGLSWKLRSLSKILRRLNVYFSHKDSKYY